MYIYIYVYIIIILYIYVCDDQMSEEQITLPWYFQELGYTSSDFPLQLQLRVSQDGGSPNSQTHGYQFWNGLKLDTLW